MIPRRDFLNASLLGMETVLCADISPLALLQGAQASEDLLPASDLGDEWYGYGGVGDYRHSHGNTPEVVFRAHSIRDGRAELERHAIDTGEIYDLVIVGGGMAGLGAALEFVENRKSGEKALLLENHPVFGGESKRNEFLVDGVRLIAPQGANGFSVPERAEKSFAAGDAYYYAKLNIPRAFHYPPASRSIQDIRFGQDDYGFLYWLENDIDIGYFFDQTPHDSAAVWVKNPWQNNLEDTPLPQKLREAALRWRNWTTRPQAPANLAQWLDSMTYRQFVVDVMGLDAGVLQFADPILASAAGGGSDVLSAYSAYAIGMPGVNTFYEDGFALGERHSFPGGNDGFARCFMKAILPNALSGGDSFEEIITASVRFSELDKKDNPVRLRLSATVTNVQHEGAPENAEYVTITYVKDRRLFKIRARAVVMATGGWINKYIIKDLPASHHAAYSHFIHTPMLVANVAVRHWQFLEKLGISGFRWTGDLGFAALVKRPMYVGDYRPPFRPDAPAVLSFYIPFYYPGHSAREQSLMGRTELLSTSFSTYEKKIRRLMTKLFAAHGFDDQRDIAGIILNRWGHAYVLPEPGFYTGRDDIPAPPDIIRKRHGRIAIGHSELRGNQHWGPAAAEGARACRLLRAQVL